MFEHEITDWSNERRFNWSAVALAVLISVLFVTAAYAFGAAGFSLKPTRMGTSPQICIKCPPGEGTCEPDCTLPPCPTPYVIDLESGVQVSATNVTISYGATSSSPLPGGTGTVVWGNSAAYPWRAVSGQSFELYSSAPASVYINFLEPSTTYDYKIWATGTCHDSSGTHTYNGTLTGQWTTGADHSMIITGQVLGENGTAAAYTLVEIRCQTANPPWINYLQTNGNGYYTENLSIGNKVLCTAPYHGYEITASAVTLGLSGYDSFPGYWNETIVVWAPQIVNFGLPTTTETWLPMAAAFVNNNGRAIQGGTYYLDSTNSESSSGYSFSSSIQFKESGNFTYPVNQNQVILGLYQTDGMLVMNATTNRTPYIGAIQYWGPQLKSMDNPNYTADPDTLANFNPTNCAGSYEVNKPAGTWWNGSTTVAGSVVQKIKAGVYLSWGIGVGIGVDFGLGGIGIGVGPDISFTLVDTSETVTVSETATWGWNVHYTESSQYYSVCFDTSGPGNTEVMHIYESSS